MLLKDRFSNDSALNDELKGNWTSIERVVRAKVGHLEAEYKRVKKRQGIGAAMLIGALVMVYAADWITGIGSGTTGVVGGILGWVITILFIPLLVFLVIGGVLLMRDKTGVVRRFNLGLNSVLFEEILKTLNLTGKYLASPVLGGQKLNVALSSGFSFLRKRRSELKDRSASSETQVNWSKAVSFLDDSELITEPRNQVNVDDMIKVNYAERELFVSELDVKNVTGSGKRRQEKKIFSGYFVTFELGRELKGKTFISTEGDERGFGHRSFWNDLQDKGVQETELEWNDFENLLHVASTDPVEARYILTTDFMEDLYDWWEEQKRNIRISFIGNRLFMLFPSKRVRFYQTVPTLKTEDLQEYAMSIATPLLRVLHLLEDVKL